MGTVYCEEHAQAAPQPPPYSPYTAPYTGPQDASASPGLAFLLGLIPGVGAIYNGQYAKGLIHVVVLGLLISMLNSGVGPFEPVFVMITIIWVLYMPFEAYHTARRRALGLPVDEFSALVPMGQTPGTFPIGPVALIVIGIVFLLHNLEVLRFEQILRFWPVALIVLGVYLLAVRVRGVREPAGPVSSREEVVQ